MKDDRGGIGMDSEKKRKICEVVEVMEGIEKKRKVGEDEYRVRIKEEWEGKRNEGMMWLVMWILEGFEIEDIGESVENVNDGEKKSMID